MSTEQEGVPKPQFETKSVDMPAELEAAASEIIVDAILGYQLESEAAAKIKKQMDSEFGDTWHCIVGSTFGSYVSHTSGHFIYGDVEHQNHKKSILLFKTE